MPHRFSEYAYDSPDYLHAYALRNELLRKPLGLNLDREDRSGEPSARHFGIFENGELIACLIAVAGEEKRVRIKQMATRLDYQGHGVGKSLMEQVEKELAGSGVLRIDLHARVSAIGFYRKLGYEQVGNEFEEVTIPHVKMTKALVGNVENSP